MVCSTYVHICGTCMYVYYIYELYVHMYIICSTHTCGTVSYNS